MKDLVNQIDKNALSAWEGKCVECGKNCKTKRGCLITQIQNEINKERDKPISFMAVNMKLMGIPESDIAYALSVAKDYKNRGNPFSKCFFGMVRLK